VLWLRVLSIDPLLMSIQESQAQYATLHFDLDKIQTRLQAMKDYLGLALGEVASVVFEERKLAAEGKTIPARTHVDIATRASIGASLAMLIPQFDQIDLAIQHGQAVCESLCPALKKSDTVN
jgi:hypothetical protein